MKTYAMYFVVGFLVVLGLVFYYRGAHKESASASPVSTESKVPLPTVTPSGSENIAVDISLCKLQQNKVYLCPASALKNFGPVTIKNAGQQNTCRISYDQISGYVFEGATKSSTIPAGDFLASVTDTGEIANIVRNNESQSLTFFVGGSKRIVHVMIVDGKDYSRDQCLEI